MGYNRKRKRTSIIGGWTVGPTRSVSLRDTPVENLAEALNTAQTFVVVLDAFRPHALATIRWLSWSVIGTTSIGIS